jgi:hypothetical protein
MKKFGEWCLEITGQKKPENNPLTFFCKFCKKGKPLEEMNCEQRPNGFLILVCDNCIHKIKRQ